MESSNFSRKGFNHAEYVQIKEDQMNFSRTLNKALMLTIVCIIFGVLSWQFLPVSLVFPLLIVSFVLGLGIVLFLAFKPRLAKYLVLPYAILEGLFLGLVSKVFEALFPGIVLQAVLLTCVIALLMNVLYQKRIIKVTQKFRSIMMIAIFSIFGIYLISFILTLFGTSIPYIHSSGPIGIGFSLIVVGIASLTFLLDFDMIEQFVKKGVHKDYEWYGAFSLLVTLVWLYLEILKLLSKIRGND